MALQRVQMLLDPRQRQKLAKLAQSQGKSIAEITRQAIDAGLEQLERNNRKTQLETTLQAAQQLRDSMPMLEIDVVADIRQMREERDDELSSRD
ncbi:MAG: hypothetical protein EHM70_16175 [Chloroflexota bacterium]|nr:MAG: hypothetical protein EHM70_16175 [Chloroflexota bacterium]